MANPRSSDLATTCYPSERVRAPVGVGANGKLKAYDPGDGPASAVESVSAPSTWKETDTGLVPRCCDCS